MGDRLNKSESKIYYPETKLYDASAAYFILLKHNQYHFQNQKNFKEKQLLFPY